MSTLDFLHGIDVVEVTDGARPIRTLKSSVIGLVGTAGKGPVNKSALIVGNQRDAVAIFGAYTSDKFSIPRALDQIFKQGGATVVVVNVCDPDVHIAEAEVTETVKLVGNTGKTTRGFLQTVGIGTNVVAPYVVTTAATVTLPSGCVKGDILHPTTGATLTEASLVVGQRVNVEYTATLVLNTDYTLNKETGEISRVLSGSKLLPNATIEVTFDYTDPEMVTESEIIGTIEADGTPTGIQALWAAKSEVFVHPRIILAPGYTGSKPDIVTRNPTTVALQAMADRLKAVAIIESPNATKEEAVAHRLDFESDRLFFIHPHVKVLRPGNSGEMDEVPGSPFVAGLIAATDNDPSAGFWWSPSNRLVNGPLGLSKPIDFSIGDSETVANYLNGQNVAVFIREDGFRLWGNRVSSGQFLSVRRTADMIEASIAEAHRWAVDKNITKGYVAQIVASVNAYIRMLTAQGAVLGGEAWADKTLNTPESIALGRLFIDFKFTPPYPAEHITFRAHLTNEYISSIFD